MNDMFSKVQFGFRRGLSTQDAVLNLVNFTFEAMERNEYAVVKMLDLSKAFDCVDHGILLNKLTQYNWSMSAVSLLQSFLSDRKVAVKINHNLSEFLNLDMGVPQGSVLGPLLYNMYTNDFCGHAGHPDNHVR